MPNHAKFIDTCLFIASINSERLVNDIQTFKTEAINRVEKDPLLRNDQHNYLFHYNCILSDTFQRPK